MKRLVSTAEGLSALNPRYPEYDEYLEQHISGVERAWQEMLRPNITQSMLHSEDDLPTYLHWIDSTIDMHDRSKFNDDEYMPYCNYFYPSPGFEKNEADFDLAWLKHQHRNPHHHQHWVLTRDENERTALDMPFNYICEMLCDWHSFSLSDPESTAYKWWTDNKGNMTLSKNTIYAIEVLIEFLKEPLRYELQEV